MKKIIQAAWTRDHLDQQKLTRALLQYRNTPSLRDQLSPAQKLFGRPIQDALPAHHRAFAPQWQTTAEEAEKQVATKAKQVETYYNQHTRMLPEIRIGSHVAVQNTVSKQWDIYGVVTAISPHRRYFVKTSNGQVLFRNRQYLRRRVPLLPPVTTLAPPSSPPADHHPHAPLLPPQPRCQHDSEHVQTASSKKSPSRVRPTHEGVEEEICRL